MTYTQNKSYTNMIRVHRFKHTIRTYDDLHIEQLVHKQMIRAHRFKQTIHTQDD